MDENRNIQRRVNKSQCLWGSGRSRVERRKCVRITDKMYEYREPYGGRENYKSVRSVGKETLPGMEKFVHKECL